MSYVGLFVQLDNVGDPEIARNYVEEILRDNLNLEYDSDIEVTIGEFTESD